MLSTWNLMASCGTRHSHLQREKTAARLCVIFSGYVAGDWTLISPGCILSSSPNHQLFLTKDFQMREVRSKVPRDSTVCVTAGPKWTEMKTTAEHTFASAVCPSPSIAISHPPSASPTLISVSVCPQSCVHQGCGRN